MQIIISVYQKILNVLNFYIKLYSNQERNRLLLNTSLTVVFLKSFYHCLQIKYSVGNRSVKLTDAVRNERLDKNTK